MEEMTIGQRIAAKRRELGLSQSDLGDRLGVSRQAISKWEGDAAIPDVEKLVGLSKLFGVSVGWILGVEDFDTRAGDCPPADEATFTARERELLELLARPRPTPRWLKVGAVALAAVLALMLLGNAVGYIRSRRQAAEYMEYAQSMMSEFAAHILSEMSGEPMPSSFQLAEYDFVISPHGDSTGADVRFEAVPTLYREGMTAVLQVLLAGTEVDRVPCIWDNQTIKAPLVLDALDGYSFCLEVTDTDGAVWKTYPSDVLVGNLASALRFGEAELRIAHSFPEGGQLVLENVNVRVALPRAWADVPDIWRRCDLVACQGDVELDRVDLLNRSTHSREQDFSGTQVDFTTRTQTLDLQGEPVDSVKLVLECEFWNGTTMTLGERELDLG